MRKRTVGISRILASVLLVMVLVGRATPGLSAQTSEKGSGSENPGTTTLVSATSEGMQGNNFSGSPSISSDGQYVAFCSGADNLVPDDTNTFCDNDGDGVWDDNCWDIFVHDRQTGETTRVSVASDGTQADGTSSDPSISADGRHVAFRSYARNLVPGDSNPASDIFVHDRQTGETTRISLASNGTEANYDSRSSAISADGRFIAFVSWATNLVPGDTNDDWDVFVYDRHTQTMERVAVGEGYGQGGGGYALSISAEGRYVVYRGFVYDRQAKTQTSICGLDEDERDAVRMATLSADGRWIAYTDGQVYICDRQSGTITPVSVAPDGAPGNGPSGILGGQQGFSGSLSLSADGRWVVLSSQADNLLPGETFLGEGWAFNSALYVIGGVGITSFADDDRFTINFGAGYRFLATDWLAIHLDARDHVFNIDLLGKEKTAHNLELTTGITVFF